MNKLQTLHRSDMRVLWCPDFKTRRDNKRRRAVLRDQALNALPGNSHYIIFPESRSGSG